jgi:cell division septation protein DedD
MATNHPPSNRWRRLFSNEKPNSGESVSGWSSSPDGDGASELALARQFLIGAVVLVVVSCILFFTFFKRVDATIPTTADVKLTVVDAKTGTVVSTESKIDEGALAERFTDMASSAVPLGTEASAASVAAASGSVLTVTASHANIVSQPLPTEVVHAAEARAASSALSANVGKVTVVQPKTLATDAKKVVETSKKLDAKTTDVKAGTKDEVKEDGLRWWIQVAAFQHQGAAKKMADKLKGQGFRVQVDTVPKQGILLFRVKVGPFPLSKQDSAKTVQQKLKKLGYEESRLLKMN